MNRSIAIALFLSGSVSTSAFAQSKGDPQLFQATEFSGGVCVDTAPLGDGWGWNGDCGCRVSDNDTVSIPGFGEFFDVDDNTAAISLSGIQNTCEYSGGVGIFEKKSGQWQNTANLITSARARNDYFPEYVGVSGDVVVASSTPQSNRLLTVFRKNNDDQWYEEQVIDTGNGFRNNNDHMFDVDGNHIVLATDGPTAKVYTYDGAGNWVEQVLPVSGTPFRTEVLGDTLVVSNYGGEYFVFGYVNEQWQLEAILVDAERPSEFGPVITGGGGPQFSLTKDIIFTRYSTYIKNTANQWIQYPEANVNTSSLYSIWIFDEVFPLSKTAPLTVEKDDNQLKTFMLQNNVWQNIDTLEMQTYNDLKFDGKTLLAVGGDPYTVRSFTIDANGYFATATESTTGVGSAVPDGEGPIDSNPVAGCDYSNSASYGGWGWNAMTSESCAPLETVDGPQPTVQCVDLDGDGWGWDGTGSCRVNAGTAVTASVDLDCDYSDADLYDGWGWNSTTSQSCAPLETVSSPQATAQCIDVDGDGWGWDGSASCIP